MELRVQYKDLYFDLLEIKQEVAEQGITVKALDRKISKTRAVMLDEDAAVVERAVVERTAEERK